MRKRALDMWFSSQIKENLGSEQWLSRAILVFVYESQSLIIFQM